MNKELLLSSLGSFGYPLFSSLAVDIVDVLNALIDSEDPRLLEGFPVVIANGALKNQKLDLQKLFNLIEKDSVKKKRLEKLLIVSSQLLTLENIDQSSDLSNLVKSLKTEYGNLLAKKEIDIGDGIALSAERLSNTFKRYTFDLKREKRIKERARDNQRRSFKQNSDLSKLFAHKQKDIVLKKYHGEPLTKTEQEYYSRTIKKKLAAMANKDLIKIAMSLTKR